MNVPHVVIIGGGFGGLSAAKGLKRAPARVTLIDRSNHHLFQPLLYQVATAGLSPADIAVPIRGTLAHQESTDVLMAEVIGIDPVLRQVRTSGRLVDYDFLVIASGASHSYFGHPEWAPLAPGLKTVNDATRIRRNILMAFEAAESEQDAERKKECLCFVVVGGGPTGVELAGSIAEVAHFALASDFRHIDPASARIILIEAGPRLLASFPEVLSRKAEEKLKSLGVEVRTGTRVQNITPLGVSLGAASIAARTVIWAAGVVASPAGRWLGAATDPVGRVLVSEDLSVPGHPEIYVIGDTARFMQDGHPLPGVAPVALQQGRWVAKRIWALVRKKKRVPDRFHYLDKGNLATIGRSYAIADIRGLHLKGFVGWVVWAFVHIYYLIGFRNRQRVLLDWAWAYLSFGRGARLITPPSAD